MSNVAIIAALPRELAHLARDLGATRVSNANGILLESVTPRGESTLLLATAGMGHHRVALAVAAALAHNSVSTLLSIGLAGACDPGLAPGSVLEASLVIDSRSGERFTPDASLGIAAPGVLATSAQIAGVEEKRRLHQTYNALAVDMEAATVARLARAHGIRFAALKAISDEHDVDLTALSQFTGPQGQFRTAAFALHTALRPRRWHPAAQLGRNSKVALENLTSAVHQHLAQLLSSAG